MKAAGQTADHKARPMADAPADDGGEARDDIARLLRALNDDLKADPAEEDDLLSPDAGRKAERHLPIGKIAAALAAAIGIGAVVVMLDQGGDAPSAPPAPLITAVPSAPAPGGGSPGGVAPAQARPEALITRAAPAPAPAQPPMQTQTVVAPAPAVATPPMALPQIPPPALKVPEPPALPSPAPAVTKPADPAPHPVETAENAKVPAHPPVSTIAPPPPEPAKTPAPVKTTETAELQAMLSAPPPPAAAQRQAAVARPAPQPAKPAPKSASTTPASTPPASTPPATASSSGVLTPPAPAGVPDGRYTVQVGSFQQADNAEGLVRRLRGLGFNAYALDWTDAEQRSWHVVRVGGYADTAAARQAAASLKGKVEAQPIVVSTR
ncbi:hypothetical protein [Azospirillum argentinense]